MKLFAAIIVSLAVVAVAAAASPRDPKKVIVPAVQAKARAINVQLSDLPKAGWQVKPASSSGGTPKCSFYNPDQSDLTENGDLDSPEFTLPSSSFISSSTGIFMNAVQGRTAYSRVVQPNLPKCLAEIFVQGAGGPKKASIVSSAAVAFPKLADRTNAYRIISAIKASPKVTVRAYLDLVVMNRGKVDTVIFFAGIGGPFSSSFEHQLATKVAGRMATA